MKPISQHKHHVSDSVSAFEDTEQRTGKSKLKKIRTATRTVWCTGADMGTILALHEDTCSISNIITWVQSSNTDIT